MFAGFQDKDRGSESAKKLKKDSSGRLHILQLDVTSEKQILAAAAYVKENLPHGTSGKLERNDNETENQITAMFEVEEN